MLNIRLATTEEYASVRDFYYRLIDMMEGSEYHPAWEKGVYPTDDYLERSLEQGEMWVCESDGVLAGAMVLNHQNNEGYQNVPWTVNAAENDASVIHILGVLPTFQGKGIGSAMVKKAIEIAEKTGQKAIRLDVLDGNLPAEKLYLKYGFQYIDTVRMFYEDTGWTDFKLFEYQLCASALH